MKGFPFKSANGFYWWVMLPFKAYVMGAVVTFAIIWFVSPPPDPYWTDKGPRDFANVVLLLSYGYVVSISVLLAGAAFKALYARDKKAMWSALAYAGAGFLILGFLWPKAFPPLMK
jgi:hypothetical protein